MKYFPSSILLLLVYGCTTNISMEKTDHFGNNHNSFHSAVEKTSLPLSNNEIRYLDSVLNSETLTEYYKEEKDTNLDRDFDNHAYQYWNDIENLNLIDSSPFFFQISESTTLKSSITSIEHSNDAFLVFLKMSPDDGSSWSCGACPGITFILKYRITGQNYTLEGTTGRVPYSFKYGHGISKSEVVLRERNSYLLVTTDAGGVGQGREGVTIYSMEPFGNILYSKIFITGYRGVNFYPRDVDRTAWVLEALNTDTNIIKPTEIHINADLELDYSLNTTLDTINISRNGTIDYHVYYRDLEDNNRSIDDTTTIIAYSTSSFL